MAFKVFALKYMDSHILSQKKKMVKLVQTAFWLLSNTYLSSCLFSGPVRCLYLRIYRSNLWERNHSDVNIWISYNRNLAGKNYFFYTTMRKNTYILQTIQDELTLSSDVKSTLNFGLEKCIYKKYLTFDIFHHSPTLTRIKTSRFMNIINYRSQYRSFYLRTKGFMSVKQKVDKRTIIRQVQVITL